MLLLQSECCHKIFMRCILARDLSSRIPSYLCTMHIKRTGHPLIVREVLKEPIVTESEVVEWDRKALGQKFKQDGAAIAKAVEALDQVQLAALKGVCWLI